MKCADKQMFAALVPAILLGAAAERSRMLPALIFIFCWTTLVYDPLAHWVWSANGWAFKWGVLDCKSLCDLEVPSADRQTLAVVQSKSHPVPLVSPTRISSARDEDGVPTESSLNPPMSVKLSSVQSFSGSDGSDSTVDHVSPDQSKQHSPCSTPTWLEVPEPSLGYSWISDSSVNGPSSVSVPVPLLDLSPSLPPPDSVAHPHVHLSVLFPPSFPTCVPDSRLLCGSTIQWIFSPFTLWLVLLDFS